MTRFSVYKNGYVNESGKVEDPLFLGCGLSETKALNNSGIKPPYNDIHTVQEQFDGVYWVSIEGTEKQY